MGYFQDMGLLFIYSLIVLLWKEPDRTLIFAILWAVILICGIYFIHGKSTKVLVCTVFALMALVVPEIEMFYLSREDSHLFQVVSNSKFVSVGVQSPTEINAPRGCAVIL